jgi:hypothetical protein
VGTHLLTRTLRQPVRETKTYKEEIRKSVKKSTASKKDTTPASKETSTPAIQHHSTALTLQVPLNLNLRQQIPFHHLFLLPEFRIRVVLQNMMENREFSFSFAYLIGTRYRV